MPRLISYNNEMIACIGFQELLRCDISSNTLKNGLKRHRQGEVSCWSHHHEGKTVWIHYDTLKQTYKDLITERLCGGQDIYRFLASDAVSPYIICPDHDRKFIENYRTAKGECLPPECQTEYIKTCAYLHFLSVPVTAKQVKRMGITSKGDLRRVVITLANRDKHRPLLPGTPEGLSRKIAEYRTMGAECVISKNWANLNAQKVTPEIERLLLNLFASEKKPYYWQVHNQYMNFLNGGMEVIDITTGEIFNNTEFTKVSQATVYNWIRKPENAASVEKQRNSWLLYNAEHRPHMNRKAPVYSLSKLTMDDITIPFKLHDGTRVWAYQVFDVLSGCVVGRAYAKDKNRELFMDAIRNLVSNIITNGWSMPGEMEVEQHIANTFKGKPSAEGNQQDFEADILTAGTLFPFVRFCRGGNPQEKRAEGFIRQKKLGVQAQREGFQYRPFARLEANRLNTDKNRIRYTFTDVVSNEERDITEYNNQPHTDQGRFPGMTRWQVLVSNINPSLPVPDLASIAWYVGESREIKLHRSQYFTVRGRKYMLPSADVLRQMAGLKLKAYWFEAKTDEIYMYYRDKFQFACTEMNTFNEAMCEQTDADIDERNRQFGFISRYDHIIRDKIDSFKSLQVNQVLPGQEDEMAMLPQVRTDIDLRSMPAGRKMQDITDEEESEDKYVQYYLKHNGMFNKTEQEDDN